MFGARRAHVRIPSRFRQNRIEETGESPSRPVEISVTNGLHARGEGRDRSHHRGLGRGDGGWNRGLSRPCGGESGENRLRPHGRRGGGSGGSGAAPGGWAASPMERGGPAGGAIPQLTSTSLRSMTFVWVGPVMRRSPRGSNTWKESLSSRLARASIPSIVALSTVVPSATAPAA